jgi:hypothetical protein
LANTEKPMDQGGGAPGAPGAINDQSGLQQQVTEFNPASGQFEPLSQGTQSVELGSADVPGDVDESTELTGESVVPGA